MGQAPPPRAASPSSHSYPQLHSTTETHSAQDRLDGHESVDTEGEVDYGCLPAELERTIIELAAQLHPSTVPSLLYVCRRIHEWVEPFLFTSLVITPRNLQTFLRHPFKRKPRSFFRHHVQSICITYGVDWFTSIPILAACSNAQNVTYWAQKPSPGQLAAHQKQLPFPIPLLTPRQNGAAKLRRVSIAIQAGVLPLSPAAGGSRTTSFFSSSRTTHNSYAFDLSVHEPFQSLTHLEILETSGTKTRSLFAGYELLPLLTHLAMDAWGTLDEIGKIVRGCRQLKVLVLLGCERERAEQTREVADLHGWDPSIRRKLIIVAASKVSDIRPDLVTDLGYGFHDGWNAVDSIMAKDLDIELLVHS